MAEKSRGTALTIFAVLFALLAVSNFLKPLHLFPSDGFVFLGTKLTGAGNFAMSSVFGIFLLVYAYGIWTMRKFAQQAAYMFVLWVLLNMSMFAMKNPGAQSLPATLFSMLVGIGIPLASAIVLRRRSADLA